MLSPWLSLLLAATGTVAQTYTSCNPLEKTCPDNAGLSSTTYTHDFTTSGADNDNWKVTAGNIKYTSAGAEFTVAKAGDAPTIQSNWYIFFGRVSFFLKAAPGQGIVSSAILESDDLDEVDWEWLGGAPYNSKTSLNYFGKGNTSSYDRGSWAPVSDTQSTTHNYTITWTAAATTWYIDNVPVRTLHYADAVGGKNYPQTPMNVRVGIWAGGDPRNAKGTIEWAGGETDYAAGPYTMVLERVEVVNENPAKSYAYGDRSGSWESVLVDGKTGAAGVVEEGKSGSTTAITSSEPSSSSPASSSVAPSSSSDPVSTDPASSSSDAPASSTAVPASSKSAATTMASLTTATRTSAISKATATATATVSASASESARASPERAGLADSLAPSLSLGLWYYGSLGLLVAFALFR